MFLTNKRVVIIGGTFGIGLATAHAVIDAGAEVIIASSRQSSIDAALGELSASTTGHALDVLDTTEVQAFFDEIGGFDHLVYTAGESLSLLPVDGMNIDQARSFFQVRFFGALKQSLRLITAREKVARAWGHLGCRSIATCCRASRRRSGRTNAQSDLNGYWSLAPSACEDDRHRIVPNTLRLPCWSVGCPKRQARGRQDSSWQQSQRVVLIEDRPW